MSESISFQNGEKILLKLRKHWIVLTRDTVATAVLGMLPFILVGILGATLPVRVDFSGLFPFGALLSTLWILVVWMTLAVLWTNYYLDLWIVTDRRVISVDQIGLFNRRVTSLSLEDIQEITVHTQNIFEAVFHYGTIEVETAGPDDEPAMEGIPRPERMRAVILEQMHALRGHGGSDTRGDGQELLRTASHEIKNYLAKDAAALASIAEGDYEKHPAMLKSVAGQALTQSRKGVQAVMQMLDAGGKIVLNIVPFDLAASVRAIAREYEVAAHKKNLVFSVAADGSAIVNGDEEKIGRIVVKNLLDNAIHYTPGGSIRIVVEKEGAIVRLAVADTGVGLSHEDMAKLFTPGGKGEGSTEVNPASTGYGLSIVKQLVEAHGGRIWAESPGKGKGSAFIVELPAAS